jgi:hypothetical protein
MAFLSLFILINVNGQSLKTDSLEKLLFELPDVIFKKLEPSPNFESTYLIKIKQPIDHNDLSKGIFYQKVYLTHKGFDRPTVIVTEGYSMWENSDYELTELLNANQIKVEHRYFGDSKPDTMNYCYLNLKQSVADLHYVRKLFSEIYSEKWILTGLSKGGVTAIVYRYFYPEDIDVCVPFVAPIITSNNDQRFTSFLDSIFGDECSDKIKSLQTKLLKNRDRVIQLIQFYVLGTKNNYNRLTIEQAFEYAVLEFPSCLIEYSSCEEIPDLEESIEKTTKYFLKVSKIHWYSDEFLKNFDSYFYQAVTEIGGYGYDTKELEHLLVAFTIDQDPRLIQAPLNISIKYDGKLMNDVLEWLNTEGDKFIHIYGERDFWTAGAVPQNENVDSEWFFIKNKHHENTRISEMSEIERKRLISTLENWLSFEIEDIFYNKE